MALSMDEQRILAQIEQHLASGDPDLAARLSSFGKTGAEHVLRMPRARVAGSAAALVAVAIVSLIVYALIPFRALPDRGATGGHPARAVMTAQRSQKSPSMQVASPAAAPAHARSR
jgi:hypothetical protein